MELLTATSRSDFIIIGSHLTIRLPQIYHLLKYCYPPGKLVNKISELISKYCHANEYLLRDYKTNRLLQSFDNYATFNWILCRNNVYNNITHSHEDFEMHET